MRNPFIASRDDEPSKGKIALNYLIVCLIVLAVFWVALGVIGYR